MLYNKDSIIEWLLKGVEAFGDGEEVLEGRIHSLKDVIEVKFEEGRICPVSRKELGPGAKAVYLVPCGHAFSESSVKEVGEGVCLKVRLCSTPSQRDNNNHEGVNMFVGCTLSAMNHTRMITSSQ